MVLNSEEQLNQAIQKSQHALVLVPSHADGDMISASWVIYLLLKQLNKTVAFIFPDKQKNPDWQKLTFLSPPGDIQEKIVGAQDFILSFNTQHKKIINVKTEENKNELRIYITPEYGALDPRDFSFIPSSFHYDLVITVGIPDKESLGNIYEENPDIFYEIPTVNIDYRSHNDNFGQINLVDVTASSNSEIIFNFLEKYFPQKINQTVANLLLSGIITATDSFQKKNTTPRALQVSAKLIDLGADQQNIIRHLYKTQPLSLLKLWGKTMANLKYDQDNKLVWTTLTLEDFIQTRTQPGYLPEILTKIKSNYSEGKIFAVIYQEEAEQFKSVLSVNSGLILKKLTGLPEFKTENNLISYQFPATNLDEAEKNFITQIKNILTK